MSQTNTKKELSYLDTIDVDLDGIYDENMCVINCFDETYYDSETRCDYDEDYDSNLEDLLYDVDDDENHTGRKLMEKYIERVKREKTK